ncbi:hypothetical protein O181_057441 [Austropuccinia psidii MF-1]|uniref:Reverse transcriptase RNase H-like domain-containing protein n=1 Tax=Austropuccinia psidii MF-1 TaxID=1389203 RepID=A0A9Q3E8C2_9BASI|nr:hypothetical protein [Austropuccinia psidii MF-1]
MGGYDERELDVTKETSKSFQNTPWKDEAHNTTPRSHQLSSSIPSSNDLDTPRKNTRKCTLEIVEHVVSFKGRTIPKQKTKETQDRKTPLNKKEMRGSLGLCACGRMFIETFSQVASPIRRQTREDVDWDWDQKCEEAFHKLRAIVGEEITLKKSDYEKGAGRIKLAVDSSYIAAGAVLTQEDKEGKDRPLLYESITFSKLESKYSQPKLELCGVARILKKLQKIIWGQHFELKFDSKALIEIINTPFLPHAPMRRWVAFLQLFSFDSVHKPGKNFTITDGISRRPKNSEYEDEDAPEFYEEENWIKPHSGFRAKIVNSLNCSGK